jgi:hypothetical protein
VAQVVGALGDAAGVDGGSGVAGAAARGPVDVAEAARALARRG